jgi:hypothetical protein
MFLIVLGDVNLKTATSLLTCVPTEVQLGITFFTCTSIGFNIYFAFRHLSNTAPPEKNVGRRTLCQIT